MDTVRISILPAGKTRISSETHMIKLAMMFAISKGCFYSVRHLGCLSLCINGLICLLCYCRRLVAVSMVGHCCSVFCGASAMLLERQKTPAFLYQGPTLPQLLIIYQSTILNNPPFLTVQTAKSGICLNITSIIASPIIQTHLTYRITMLLPTIGLNS